MKKKVLAFADPETLIPKLRERLQKSASGYVQVRRFKTADRAALRIMIDSGEAELFTSPMGPAYRLKAVTP